MLCSFVIWLSHEIRDMLRYTGATSRTRDEHAENPRNEPRP